MYTYFTNLHIYRYIYIYKYVYKYIYILCSIIQHMKHWEAYIVYIVSIHHTPIVYHHVGKQRQQQKVTIMIGSKKKRSTGNKLIPSNTLWVNMSYLFATYFHLRLVSIPGSEEVAHSPWYLPSFPPWKRVTERYLGTLAMYKSERLSDLSCSMVFHSTCHVHVWSKKRKPRYNWNKTSPQSSNLLPQFLFAKPYPCINMNAQAGLLHQWMPMQISPE